MGNVWHVQDFYQGHGTVLADHGLFGRSHSLSILCNIFFGVTRSWEADPISFTTVTFELQLPS